MAPHYVYDVKLFATVHLEEQSPERAAETVRAALDGVKISVVRPTRASKALLETMLYVDDEGGPLLMKVDDVEVYLEDFNKEPKLSG